MLFFLLAPTHLTSACSTRTTKFLTSLLQKTPAPLLPHYYRKTLAPLLTHSYKKHLLLFFHSCRKPQPSFPTRTATRLVSGYSAQTRELRATPTRKMESAGPGTKKMRLPPVATPVVDPAPGSTGRSGDPAPTGSQEPVESRVDRISDRRR